MKKKNKATNPLVRLIIKMTILTLIIGALILYSDKKGYFNPDETDNHTLRKWDSFYALISKRNKVDIMLFGNSHLYTGINPKNLSLTMGATSFVYASPGTNIADSYFGLKEAVKKCKPKLVVIETYGMNNFNPYTLKGGALSDQFKSFSARRDFSTKLVSTPCLFSADNYFYAWSTTIRNHDYIFTKKEQLEKNKTIINNDKKRRKNEKLYLGRYVRFQSGIEKEILERYEKEGAPVDGKDYSYSRYTELYVKKIVEFCKKKDIELMFLTLPMYDKHISDYNIWQGKLAEVLDKFPIKWLNLQKMPDYGGFDAFAFENTFSSNQHMTYQGSLLATYKLADFIRDSLNVKMPQRQKDNKWHGLFYGDEGYFENYNPSKKDKNNKIICSNKKLRNITIKSCLWLDINNKKANKIIVKIDKQQLERINLENTKLQVSLKIEHNNKEQIANLDLFYDKFHSPENEVIFTSMIIPLIIKDVVDGKVVMK